MSEQTMSEQKSHADIIAEMRRDSHEACEHGTFCIGNYADRLEAAHKREVDELKKSIGNAAKLSEALKGMVDVIDVCATNDSMWWRRGTIGTLALKRARAALAAPARNCDIYATVEEARKVWCGAPSRDWDYLCDWLYAISNETEATDGNK